MRTKQVFWKIRCFLSEMLEDMGYFGLVVEFFAIFVIILRAYGNHPLSVGQIVLLLLAPVLFWVGMRVMLIIYIIISFIWEEVGEEIKHLF